MISFKTVLVFLCCFCASLGQFRIPPVTLEAYTPSGLRASIPADEKTERFAFHGKLNEPINQIETGDFYGETGGSKNGQFTYFNPNIKLKEGDVIYYWVFVQNNQLGYRKDGQTWTVTKLLHDPSSCPKSRTIINDKTTMCQGDIVFEDDFATSINETKWQREQYMAGYPDYGFVLYKKDNDVLFVKDGQLCIKPRVREDREKLMKLENINVELGNGCTKPAFCNNGTYLLKNPIVSARLESKATFSYGEFEIKARVPLGDWIVPEIYLEDENLRRIFIAYTRGNRRLVGNAGDDLGNSLLFGGPAAVLYEPKRSEKLKSYRSGQPLGETSRVYKMKWTPDLIELFVDSARYGEVPTEPGFTGSNSGKFKLVIGINVGGVNDFPNGYKSDGYDKPWINYKATQVLDFYNKRSQWYPTWTEESTQLQIHYVKVTAV